MTSDRSAFILLYDRKQFKERMNETITTSIIVYIYIYIYIYMVIPFTKSSLGIGLRRAPSSLGNNEAHLPFSWVVLIGRQAPMRLG